MFTRSDGKRVKDFRKLWKNACQYAGLPGLYVHDLRRTAVRAQRRAGVQENTIMKTAGIRSRSIFDRYNITDQTDAVEAAEKFEAYERAIEQQRSEQLSYISVTPAKKPKQLTQGDVVN